MILGFVLRQSKKLEKPIWEDSFTNYSQLRSRAERQYTREPKSSKQWLGHRLALCVAGRRAQTTPGAVAALLGRFHAGTHAAYTNERLLALPRRTFADDAEPRVGLGVASAGLFMHWAQFESSWRASRPRRQRSARNGSCTMPVALHLSGFGTHPLRSLVLDVLVPPVPPPPAAHRVLVVSPHDCPAAFMREQFAFEECIYRLTLTLALTLTLSVTLTTRSSSTVLLTPPCGRGGSLRCPLFHGVCAPRHFSYMPAFSRPQHSRPLFTRCVVGGRLPAGSEPRRNRMRPQRAAAVVAS